MKSSTIWIVNLNKAIKFIKYIILHFSGFFKKNTLTSQLSIVTCKLVKILDPGSQPVELLLTCLGHFCTMVSPFFWVMDSYIFGFGTQCEEGMGWEVGKPRINTDFPLPTLQNSEKNVINFRLSFEKCHWIWVYLWSPGVVTKLKEFETCWSMSAV